MSMNAKAKFAELSAKTVKELREIAKELNISGRWDMTKTRLIDAILGAEKNGNDTEVKSAKSNSKVDDQIDAEVEDKVEKESTSIEVNIEEKMQYIENAEIGTLVAFKLSNGKVKSAKIEKKSSKKRRFKLVTNYGAEYIISYDDIIWVRTGKRWPRGVYELLKGNANNV